MPSLSASESSYILSGLLNDPPIRQDARPPNKFRPISLDPSSYITQRTPGAARVSLQGTQVDVVVTPKVESLQLGQNQGRLECEVGWAPHLIHTPPYTSQSLDSLSLSLQSLITLTFTSHLSSTGALTSLVILPATSNLPFSLENSNPKSNTNTAGGPSSTFSSGGGACWVLQIDITVQSISGGNLTDSLFVATRSALWRTRIPETRTLKFEAPLDLLKLTSGEDDDDGNKMSGGFLDPNSGDLDRIGIKGSFNDNGQPNPVDFELVDPTGKGKPLLGRDDLPVGITLALLPNSILLDLSSNEESSLPASTRLLVVSSPSGKIWSTQILPTFSDSSSGITTLALSDPSSTSNPWSLGIPYNRLKESLRLGVKYGKELSEVLRPALREGESEE